MSNSTRDELVNAVLEQLAKTGGSELTLTFGGKRYRILFVWSAIYSPVPSNELMIVYSGIDAVGRGVFFYDGKHPVNKFQLVSGGFQPLELADEVAKWIEYIMKAGRKKQSEMLESKQPIALQDKV